MQPETPTIRGDSDLDRLVDRSRRIGADPELVVHGGGNTSSKVREPDHRGRERTVMRVKGSGTDLATIGRDGFPGLWLDDLLAVRDRAEMTDEEMVAYLARCATDPGGRAPSIETLLHAFLPARHVDHVHADAICALANTRDPERHVRAALGPDVALVPYLRPGFALSRLVADHAGARAVVLGHHGLVTWGDTPEESLGATLALVDRANAYLRDRLARRARPTPEVPSLPDDARRALLLALRGRLSGTRRVVLLTDRSQAGFAARADVDLVATAARATPDHVLRIGARSLVVERAADVATAVDAFADGYRDWFGRHAHRLPVGLSMLSPLPKVALVPGLGAVAAGADARAAWVNADIAFRSHRVTALVLDAFGEVAWLTEEEIFDIEYWPLELRKLAGAPAPRSFAGHVALVTEAASPLGRAVAARLADDGAHLLLAGAVADTADLAATRDGLPVGAFVETAADAGPAAVDAAIDAFGGIDGVVYSGPAPAPLLDAYEAASARQGIGGAVVALVGEENAHVVPTMRSGIRVNAVVVRAGADPARVADAAAFLLSRDAGATSGAAIPVG